MPSLYNVFGYKIYFWTNENNEPIHVHVCKGKPSPNATKIWITKELKTLLAHNKSNIPAHKLNLIMKTIEARAFEIVAKWKDYFGEVKFYC